MCLNKYKNATKINYILERVDFPYNVIFDCQFLLLRNKKLKSMKV